MVTSSTTEWVDFTWHKGCATTKKMATTTVTQAKLETLHEFHAYLQKNIGGIFDLIPGEGLEYLPRGIKILEKLFKKFENAVVAGNEGEFVKNAPEDEYAPSLSDDPESISS